MRKPAKRWQLSGAEAVAVREAEIAHPERVLVLAGTRWLEESFDAIDRAENDGQPYAVDLNRVDDAPSADPDELHVPLDLDAAPRW